LNFLVLYFPLIEIEKSNQDVLSLEINKINNYDWIIFTSQNSVDIFFEKLKELSISISTKIKIACIGKKTLKSINKYGYDVSLIPSSYVSESLIKEFEKINIKNQKILIPTSKIARDIINDSLNNMGALCKKIEIYNTIQPDKNKLYQLASSLKKIDYITFFSPSAVRNFYETLKDIPNMKKLIDSSIFISIGEITSKEIKKLFEIDAYTANEYTLDGVIDKLLEISKQ
ncbi:MAG: uroporphyrinogen-III synthase, partial [Candidatus Sericytochromatia bacterium]